MRARTRIYRGRLISEASPEVCVKVGSGGLARNHGLRIGMGLGPSAPLALDQPQHRWDPSTLDPVGPDVVHHDPPPTRACRGGDHTTLHTYSHSAFATRRRLHAHSALTLVTLVIATAARLQSEALNNFSWIRMRPP